MSKNLKRSTRLHTPSEKALGLEPGELYGEDEVATTNLPDKTINGYKVEFTQNEMTSAIEAWVKGIGVVGRGYSMDEVMADITSRKKLAMLSIAKQLQVVAGLTEQTANVRSSFKQFAASVEALIEAWSSDPNTRNRPNRQKLSTALSKFVTSDVQMSLGEVLDEIEDSV